MNASYREIEAKSITRVPGITDPWFLGRYGMNLYRGCEHGCLYCDGRAERYYVSGDFAREITVKRNAVALLGRELSRVREPGFVFVGGGVCDAYQPAEARYRLARGALELALQHHLPVHVLTKSALVERDLDLLLAINGQTRAVLSFSIQTLDEQVQRRFEPGAAPLDDRWRLLAEAKRRGIAAGVMAMPLLPGISDPPEMVDALVKRAAEVPVDFICFGGLTLRPGAQKATYLEAIRAAYPQHLAGYQRLYASERKSGAPDARYYRRLEQRFAAALRAHGIPGRIPRQIFTGSIPRYAEVAVLLEHRDFERQLAGRPGPALTRAGYAIQRWARGRFAQQRSRHFTWQDLEQEFRARVDDGTLVEIEGVTEAALATSRELLQLTTPNPRTPERTDRR